MPGCGNREQRRTGGAGMTGYRYVVEITAAASVRHRADVLCWQHGFYHAADRHACLHLLIPPHLLNPGNYERSLFTG